MRPSDCLKKISCLLKSDERMKPEVEAAHSLIGLAYENMEVSGVGDGLCAVLITRIDV